MDQEIVAASLKRVLLPHGLRAPRYSIVVPVILAEHGPELLLEVRASGISQAGDPCFPGGHIEAGETSADAALRELAEETGIFLPASRLLGQLPTVQTFLGSQTDVHVCILSSQEADMARSAPDEVALLLRPAMDYFLSHRRDHSYLISGHTVWGMTAGAIHHLCDAWHQACLPES